MAAFEGDVRQLGQLGRNISLLTSVPSRAAPRVAREIERAIKRQFPQGVDSYGKAWAALKPWTVAHKHGPPPLTDTGVMRRSIRVTANRGAGITITIDAPYAGFHQTGFVNHWTGKRTPARPILPMYTMPKAWTAIIEKALKAAFKGRK